jgi:siroheme synthase
MVALRAAGVPFEVIPGVTAPVAVPALAGIPVTLRTHASAFAVVTGHERDGGTDLDWHALARMPTLVVLMGLDRLRLVMARLIACGVERQTPAAAISKGSLPDQRTIVGTVGTLADLVTRARLEPPATIVVGRVVTLVEAAGTAPLTTAWPGTDQGEWV